ncbi:hypothetical protein [Leekyejoonella antrihumi]|uniref:Uncharacterized protein n=1 Tax=Leekyejoonella antrihumi TaxID=1660198 RepID=A0A563E5T4_9MICO|nr:hypothetical protein [Leekyejoonella antrihumi]TWP37603.1 hypothetical protein FGL98_05140 [Leekyejoonella antrihumi]
MTQQVPTTELFAAGLYWRKSKIDGRKCVPAILEVRTGRLRMLDVVGQVFDVPAQEARANCTALGTMVLTVNGQMYDLVGIRARLSPKFTPEMLNYLQVLRSQVAGLAGSGSVLQLLDVAFKPVAMTGTVMPWRTVLPSVGVLIG